MSTCSNKTYVANNNKTNKNTHQSGKGYPSRTMVHAKLEMTCSGDADEQEADYIADEIISGGKISRKISSGTIGSGIAVPVHIEDNLSQLQGGGHALPEGLKNMMENGFGRDFSQVRLHTDTRAANLSSSLHAKAFTHGNDIYFNSGQYSPTSSEGQRLVAHELTHVAQGSGKVKRKEAEEPMLSATPLMSNAEWIPGSTDTGIIDENQVKWSKSLSLGLSGFNADNKAMVDLIKAQQPKVKSIVKMEDKILRMAYPTTATEMELPDVSEQDLMDIEQVRASCFNHVKNGIENSKKNKNFAKNALKDAIEKFQALGEALAILSDAYAEDEEYLVELKANVENDLTKAANLLRFEISDRWSTIYVKSEKVICGLELLRKNKENAVFFVRWTVAPSDKELDKVGKDINDIKPDVAEIKNIKDDYQIRLNSGQENHEVPFESFDALSKFAKDFNIKVENTGQELFNIDNEIYELREGAISSAESLVTGLKIASEVCFTVATSFIPGAGAARAAAWAVNGAKLAKVGNILNKASNFNKVTKLVSGAVSGAATNVAGKSMELGLKKLSNTITDEQVFDLNEWDKELEKSAISGAFSGFASGVFKLAAETPNAGIFGKAANKILNFETEGKHIAISGEGLAGGAFGLTGDKLSNMLINENHDAQWSLWDFTAVLGGLKIKSVKTTENANHLKEKEFELNEARIMERQNALQKQKSSLTDKNKIDENLSEEIQLADEISRSRKEHAEFLSEQHNVLMDKRDHAIALQRENQNKLTEITTRREQLATELEKLNNNQKNLTPKDFNKKRSYLQDEISKLTKTEKKLQEELVANSAKAKDYTKQFDDNLSKENEYASPVGQTNKTDALQKYKEYINAKYNNDDFGINTGRKYLLRWGDEDGTGKGINEDLLSSVVSATLSNENFQNLFGKDDAAEPKLQYEYQKMQEEFRFNTCYDYTVRNRYRIFFATGKSMIDNQKEMVTISKIAHRIKDLKSYGHVLVKVIGQASPRWMIKKNDMEGVEKNDKLALDRANIVKEAILDELINIGINQNNIETAILLHEYTQTADMTHAEEIDNRNNLADLRSTIVEISIK